LKAIARSKKQQKAAEEEQKKIEEEQKKRELLLLFEQSLEAAGLPLNQIPSQPVTTPVPHRPFLRHSRDADGCADASVGVDAAGTSPGRAGQEGEEEGRTGEEQGGTDKQGEEETKREVAMWPEMEPALAQMLALFDGEPWEVLLTSCAYERLQKAGKKRQEVALKILKELASGFWEESHKQVIEKHGYLALRIVKVKDLNVLWCIDVNFSTLRDAFVEVIQVWDVADDEQMPEAKRAILEEWKNSKRRWVSVAEALKKRVLDKDSKQRLPRVVSCAELEDADIATVRKFFTLDKYMLQGIHEGEVQQEGETASASERLRMRISKEQYELIKKPGPVILIGRSGSGKTLCCLYRMLSHYQNYWRESISAGGQELISHNGSFSHLNQVFVTHSSSLVNKVQDNFSNLLDEPWTVKAVAAGARLVTFADQARLPDDMQSVKQFPIFTTFRKILVMVDGETNEPFFPRKPGGTVNNDLVELAVEPDAFDPISALKQQKQPSQQRDRTAAGSGRSPIKKEVDYDVFIKKFWPKLMPKCPINSDPSLVWREIQSHIKGSYRVLDTETGYLSFSDYCESAKNISPGFEEHRQDIYNAFKTYKDLQAQWHYFDRMDACFHVVKQLKRDRYSGPPIHSVAVDEVQDLAQLELALFFLIVRKVDGLFIAGDTSQTVSRSVDFRFCDLRSLFTYFKVTPPPDLDQATVNFRSHQKILALSHHGIVRPLEQAFPHAIDSMKPDVGRDDGPKPIIVSDVVLEDLTKHLFNLDGSTGGVAFGATQCVLVRTEEAKKKLPQELQSALVLTIEQSKGLEFDDVIMVNFFADSAYKDWQVMNSFRPPKEGKAETQSRVHFERHRHTLLCSELKHLYTGVTRTMQVLLFVEQDPEKAKHAFEMWREMDLVTDGLFTDDGKAAIEKLMKNAGDSKGAASWIKVGRNLLEKKTLPGGKSCLPARKGRTHGQNLRGLREGLCS